MTLDFILPLIVGLASGFVAPLLLQLLGHKETKSRTDLNIAQAAGEIAEGGERAVAAVTKLLEEYEERNKEQKQEIINLRAQLAAMQIDERASAARLTAKIDALEGYIKLLVEILRSNNIDIPPRPDVLKESSGKIKAVR